jgi:hypothetical protein
VFTVLGQCSHWHIREKAAVERNMGWSGINKSASLGETLIGRGQTVSRRGTESVKVYAFSIRMNLVKHAVLCRKDSTAEGCPLLIVMLYILSLNYLLLFHFTDTF